MEKFLSCDWGTSSFRLRLVDAGSMAVINSENSYQGIATTYELWNQENRSKERIFFYQNFIKNQIRILEERHELSLKDLPVILSGMASSNIGMLELPYKKFPFRMDGSDLHVKVINASGEFPHVMLLISGACTSDDVMRGEETQLVGAVNTTDKTIYIFPGTHSKHVFTENGNAIDCKTYMTGEFFELLSRKSILSSSIQQSDGLSLAKHESSFANGVREGFHFNLLNSSFRIRTNILFEKMSTEDNYYYLSGILIGSELKDLVDVDARNITVVANRTQSAYYREALNALSDDIKYTSISFVNAEEATVRGQLLIYNTNSNLFF